VTNMKQLKSTADDLQAQINEITIRHIAERLQCCWDGEDALAVQQRMEQLDFDVYGVQDDSGAIYGYVERVDLDCRYLRST